MALETTDSRRSRSEQEPAPSAAATPLFRPELDVLRFFAFLAVFVHHAFVTVGGPAHEPLHGLFVAGAFGVDLFFLLSAFLITDLFLREIRAFGRLDVAAFYVRRILRIWPLYFAFLGVAALVKDRPLGGEALVWFLFFAGNWYVARSNYPGSVADPLWSVSIEEQFYVTWPLLLVAIGVRRLALIGGGLIVTAAAVRIALVSSGTAHPGIWCNALARLDPIALGILLAAWRTRLPALRRGTRAALVAIGVAGLWACGAADTFAGPGSLLVYPGVALACLAIMSGVLGWTPGTSRWARALGYLGRISYGLYVFHVLALRTVRAASPDWAIVAVGGFALTVLAAAASYELFEKHVLRLKRRFTRVPSRPPD